jgi:DNA-binding MarR family transcriptional regulator
MGGRLTAGYVVRGFSEAGDALVREGLMVRTHRNDGRTPVYELTEAGREVAAAMRGVDA